MKKLLLVIIHFILLFNTAYALPFQAPVSGVYQCFSSGESIFDANAKDIGATLAITADNSYTFTTSNATENGSVTVSEDTSNDLSSYFQSGSFLSLQPSSGSTPYQSMFVSDNYGGLYVFIRNNNGLDIRCQSSGADIAKVIGAAVAQEAPTNPTTQPTNPTTEQATQPTAPPSSYEDALSIVWSNGRIAVMTKEWCDA